MRLCHVGFRQFPSKDCLDDLIGLARFEPFLCQARIGDGAGEAGTLLEAFTPRFLNAATESVAAAPLLVCFDGANM
jgi:hypothetical protein